MGCWSLLDDYYETCACALLLCFCCRINNQRVMELEAQVEDLQEANQTAAAGNIWNRMSLPAASVMKFGFI